MTAPRPPGTCTSKRARRRASAAELTRGGLPRLSLPAGGCERGELLTWDVQAPARRRGRHPGFARPFVGATSALCSSEASQGGVPRASRFSTLKETAMTDEGQRRGAVGEPRGPAFALATAGAPVDYSPRRPTPAAAPARSRSDRRLRCRCGTATASANRRRAGRRRRRTSAARSRSRSAPADGRRGWCGRRRRRARRGPIRSTIRKGQPRCSQAFPPSRRPRAAPTTTRCR